ncbi:ShlB/FhaC/HecB family hemolysin secretion/activation protein [Leptolyngbya sp. AN02str]|uniref:ShlB/FhaC/HecB family hemolysin secretion/activation protein n=1 Tax=Leptolyngbya sp. AN02str TaxID=3423363 RepID=UPI003D3130FF
MHGSPSYPPSAGLSSLSTPLKWMLLPLASLAVQADVSYASPLSTAEAIAQAPDTASIFGPYTVFTGGEPLPFTANMAPPEAIAQLPAADPNPVRQPEPFLQPAPLPEPVEPDEPPVLAPQESAPEPAIPDAAARVQVDEIEVIGSTIFQEDDFAPIVQPYEGRSLTLEELRTVADALTQLYLDEGYLTSRAILVDQTIADGVVQFRVLEGSLERIDIEGNRRVNDAYIRSRIALGGGTPLSQRDLEDQLRLLRLNPLFDNVEASLRAGTGIGQSILVVRVAESRPFFGQVGIDNFSPPSVGSERMGVELGYRSPLGFGDGLLASYRRTTTGGANVYDLRYRIPVNPMDGTLELRAAPSDYRLDFQGLSVEGDADIYEISFRQPLVRSPRQEFALSLGFTYRNGETVIGEVFTGTTTTSVIKFGQELVSRDVAGAWAVRSQFSLGTDWFDATQGTPDGQFFSWLGQVQRVQLLNDDNVLILQGDVQLTPDPLLTSEQFAIGGGQSLRGFRQNARLGDNGFRISAEDRITIQRNAAGATILQLAPFIEAGAVWNDGNNPADTPDQAFLAGVGLGILWEPLPRLNIRVDGALPLIDLRDRSTNAQDRALYFSVNYRF